MPHCQPAIDPETGMLTSPLRDHSDPLFLERFEAFMQKSLLDVKLFAERENYPFEDARLRVAEWHCKYLRDRLPDADPPAAAVKEDHIRTTLCRTSRVLESLCEVTGVHSFVLAVNPHNPAHQGFLGGSVLGREFWRGFRGGGRVGALAFKSHCIKVRAEECASQHDMAPGICYAQEAALAKRTPASAIKAELYANVRSSLRSASGTRNAEMKWSNHERLLAYGVRIVGWPDDIPKQNPSTLSATQNKRLLDLLQAGDLHFVKAGDHDASEVPVPGPSTQATTAQETDPSMEDIDFSWAYAAEGDESVPPQPQGTEAHETTYDPRSAEEILREALGGDVPTEADPTFVPPLLLLGSGTNGTRITHYIDSHSYAHRILPVPSASRKRTREEDDEPESDSVPSTRTWFTPRGS